MIRKKTKQVTFVLKSYTNFTDSYFHDSKSSYNASIYIFKLKTYRKVKINYKQKMRITKN